MANKIEKGLRLGLVGMVLGVRLQGCTSPDINKEAFSIPTPITTEIPPTQIPPKLTLEPKVIFSPTMLPPGILPEIGAEAIRDYSRGEITLAPEAISKPTATPTETPRPTEVLKPTPIVEGVVISGESLAIGGENLPLVERSGREIANLVDAEARGWKIIAGSDGTARCFIGLVEDEVIAILGQGPLDYHWDSSRFIWISEDGLEGVVPDVIVPGSWNEETQSAGASLMVDFAFMVEQDGQFFNVALYSRESMTAMLNNLKAQLRRKGVGERVLEAQVAEYLTAQGVEILASGGGLWSGGAAKRFNLEKGQSVFRDPDTGEIKIVDAEGNLVRYMVTRWIEIKSSEAVRDIGEWLIPEIPQPTETPRPTETLIPTAIATPTVYIEPTVMPPLEHNTIETLSIEQREVILPVPIDAQDLSLSCESSAAAMAVAFVNPNPPAGFVNWERYFIEVIPRHCNPHRGYRGKIDGYLSVNCEDPQGYGVYAEPIAEAFNKAGIPARVEYGVDYDNVAAEVRAGHSVLVWISPKSVAPQYETDSETGQEYVLYLGEHCLTVIGVSKDGNRFLINDPWRGRQYWVKGFSNWSVFGGMRVVVGE